MTRKKKALAALLCVLIFLVVLVAALAVIVNELDWNRFKPQIEQRVSQAIGRSFQIAGPLQVQWSRESQESGWRAWVPRPYVTADDLKLGNAPWTQDPDMVSLDRLRVGISLLPLLHHEVDLRGLKMTGLSVNLQRQADGKANWQFDLPASQTDQGSPSTPWRVDVDRIMFDKSRVHVDDAVSRTDVMLTLAPLAHAVPFSAVAGKLLDAPDTSAASSDNAAGSTDNSGDASALTQAEQASTHTRTPTQDYVFAWTAKGRFRGLALDGHGRLGGMLTLQDATQPFPVDVDLTIGSTRAVMIGTLTDPMHLGALNLRLRLSGASMADLYPLTGVTLPDTPAYGTDGRLIANLRHANGSLFLYRDFDGHVGQSDLHGSLQFVASKPRAKLSGKVWSTQLRMKDLGPLIGVTPNAVPAKAGASATAGHEPAASKASTAAARSGKVLPTQTFRTDRWRQMDADVIFSGSHIVYDASLPLSDLNTHVVMNDGHLTIDPLSFGMAGGKIQGSLKLAGEQSPMSGAIKLQARRLQLKQLFPQMASSNVQDVLGQMSANVDLSGRGNSVAALLAHSNGEAQMLVSQGVVSRGLMELAGLNVGNYLMAKLFGDEDVKINCAAADVGITDGLLKTRVAAMDTVNAIINVSGTANFQNETLDLTVTPQSKGYRILSLRSPLYIQGTFAHPDVGVKAAPLLVRAAGVAALSVLLTPAAGLLALIAPSGSDRPQAECMSLLHQDSRLPGHLARPAKSHGH